MFHEYYKCYTHRHTDTQTCTQRHRDTGTDKQTQRHRDTHRDPQTQRHRDTETQRHTLAPRVRALVEQVCVTHSTVRYTAVLHHASTSNMMQYCRVSNRTVCECVCMCARACVRACVGVCICINEEIIPRGKHRARVSTQRGNF